MKDARHSVLPGQRPGLTFPPEEADWLRAEYARAGVILEYGAGGSTLLAAGMPGKTVFSVESDPAWVERIARWLAVEPPAARVHLHHADVGRVKEWGMPAGQSGWRRYHHYPLSVWERGDFVHPDLVLIDGRFRAGCLLAALFRITRPVTVLFDDYLTRPRYAAVERFARPVEARGRMVRFELEPRPLPAAELAAVIDLMIRPL